MVQLVFRVEEIVWKLQNPLKRDPFLSLNIIASAGTSCLLT